MDVFGDLSANPWFYTQELQDEFELRTCGRTFDYSDDSDCFPETMMAYTRSDQATTSSSSCSPLSDSDFSDENSDFFNSQCVDNFTPSVEYDIIRAISAAHEREDALEAAQLNIDVGTHFDEPELYRPNPPPFTTQHHQRYVAEPPVAHTSRQSLRQLLDPPNIKQEVEQVEMKPELHSLLKKSRRGRPPKATPSSLKALTSKNWRERKKIEDRYLRERVVRLEDENTRLASNNSALQNEVQRLKAALRDMQRHC